jgi:hypothetical protein
MRQPALARDARGWRGPVPAPPWGLRTTSTDRPSDRPRSAFFVHPAFPSSSVRAKGSSQAGSKAARHAAAFSAVRPMASAHRSRSRRAS